MEATTPKLTRLESLLWERDDARFLQDGRRYVENTVPPEGHPVLYRALEATQNEVDYSLRRRNAELRHLVHKEMTMPKDVERDGRQLVIANMHDLPAENEQYASIHHLDLAQKGWPLYASLIELDGQLKNEVRYLPTVYFVHEGKASFTIGNDTYNLQQGMQVAIPQDGPNYSFEGKATLYALECQTKLGGELVLADFNDQKRKHKCPCGWSYRISLKEEGGWGFSTHRTVMSGHDEEHEGFIGHQHKSTPEIYFTHSVKDAANITLDGITTVPLTPGKLIAIPPGTMHGVDSGKETVQHIFVGGGHKNDDFWTPSWQPLPKK